MIVDMSPVHMCCHNKRMLPLGESHTGFISNFICFLRCNLSGLKGLADLISNNSHTRILSREEFEALFEDAFELQLEETTLVPVNLQSWMDLTSTPEDIQKDIIDKMEYDLNGGDKTGFNPYIKEGQICFDHRWLLLIGKKEN